MQLRIIDYNYFQDPITTISASSENPDFPATNVKKSIRSKVWRSLTNEEFNWITLDLKTTEAIDTFILFFDPMRPIPFSEDAELTLQASATNNFSFPPLIVPLSFDADSDVISYYFSTPQNYRYWRLLIRDPGAANDYVEVSKIVLGKAATFSRAPQAGFSPLTIDPSIVSVTPYGHEYIDLYPLRRSIDLSFVGMNSDDVKQMEGIYRRLGQTNPIAIACDPLAENFDKDFLTFYGTIKEYKLRHVIKSYFNFSFTLQEMN